MQEMKLRFHYLYELEHFVRSFVGALLVDLQIVIRLEIFAPKFSDFKAAFIHVKMNVSFLKIRCTGFPDYRFGMKSFYGFSSLITDAFAMLAGVYKKYFQVIMKSFVVNF